MLFRSLIDRLLGTNDSYEGDVIKSKADDLPLKFPELLDLVSSLLDTASAHDAVEGTAAIEKVFPALQLLQRVTPPENKREVICLSLAELTSSPHWHVREKAARAYARLHFESDPELIELEWLRCEMWSTRGENARHGQLLVLRCLIEQQPEVPSHLALILFKSIASIINRCRTSDTSDVVFAASTELWRALLSKTRNVVLLDKMPVPGFVQGSPAWTVELLTNCLTDSNARDERPPSLVVKSLATSFFHEDSTAVPWLPVFKSLASLDADACITMLEQGSNFFGHRGVEVHWNTEDYICAVAGLLDEVKVGDGNISHAAAKSLAAILSKHRQQLSPGLSDYLPLAVDVLPLNATPLERDSALILSAILLDIELSAASTSTKTIHSLCQWLLLVKDAAQDVQPFDTRFAAAAAVNEIQSSREMLESESSSSRLHIDLAVLIYDLTNDDDDEVRDLAATAATRFSNITFTENTSVPATVPLASGLTLLKHLVSRRNDDPYLFDISIDRLTSSFTSISSQLLAATSQDQALFAHEKQNLFIDPAREARVWSHLALRLGCQAIAPETRQQLHKWTLESVKALVSSPQALGRASFEADVFVPVLRVVYAADVLLGLRRKYRFKDVQAAELRDGLVKVMEIIRRESGHPMLFEQAEAVVCRDLLVGAGQVSRVVHNVERNLTR
ncbi:hypothetical protein ANO11243_052070 [Dothideomycetidae sp. 11243]|nr:hypothetical protein ANO11243_052070 [fungal sp. No.11243]